MEIYNLVSFGGIFIILGFAFLLSNNRRAVNWRTIFWGIALQLLFGFLVFVLPVGIEFFKLLNQVVVEILNTAKSALYFVFGRLALSPGETSPDGESSLGFILITQSLPTIIFFSALIGTLYYFNIMQFIIKLFSKIFTKWMKTSGAESLCVSSNIFVGIEASLVVRPYLKTMTSSELFTILTASMSTIASSVLALYVFMLSSDFPSIAGHLISATIISAPASISISKLLYPETDKPETLGSDVKIDYKKPGSLIENVIDQSNAGVKLVLGIAALLISFIGFVSLINLGFTSFGEQINQLFDIHFDWTMENLLSYLFYPFTLAVGIPISDAGEISKVIAERLVITEVGSYKNLLQLIQNDVINNDRSIVICAYVLCGFAHFASLGIFIGGLAALVPDRTKDIAKLGLRALLAATLTCLLTGAVAGTFYSAEFLLLNN